MPFSLPAFRPLALLPLCLAAGWLVVAGSVRAADALAVQPAKIELGDPFEGRQLVVAAGGKDATRAAKYRSGNAAVCAVDDQGYVTPIGDGEASLVVSHAGGEMTVPVVVKGLGSPRAVDFNQEVMPLLTKLGCNAGGCHGKQLGQNGFKLSLFGFDPAFDYDALVKNARGRRISLAAPAESLLVRKATGHVPHGGGARMQPESEAHRVLLRWIAGGALPGRSDAPRVVRIRVTPGEGLLAKDEMQQLAVEAEFSDGSRRDVTRQAEFASNLDVVATVDGSGLVRAAGLTGEAAIMARYGGFVSVYKALVPHGPPLAEIAGFEPVNYVDRLAAEKWKKLGLLPSPVCDDATYLRRVTIDLCGRLPTPAEAKAFLDDASPDKRTKLVDRLLDSPDYPAYFAMRWGTILRNSNLAGADRAAYAFHNWMKDLIARNRPYDELVRGVVAASGEWQDAPAINWYWQMRDDQLHQVTTDTAQVFLGVRLACARCHHHPYERWGQADYYGLSGFFTRLGRKSFGEPPPYFASPTSTTGEKDPLTGKTPEPKYLDGPAPKFTPEEDPRHALVDWMAKPENPFFAKVLVNRLWGHFFGRGIVHEIDDLRETNPPSNAELLDALAKDFVEHKLDMKHIIRTLVTSRTYQLASDPTEQNKLDRQNFARFYPRRLIAEVLHDAVDAATGSRTKFNNVSASARAIDLPHENFGSYFLDTFDRPRRVTGCECGRSSGATLSQVLLLANSDDIENKIGAGEGRVAQLVKEKKPLPEAVEELYLATYSRRPSEKELAIAIELVPAEPEKLKAGLEDLLWALINSREFAFSR